MRLNILVDSSLWIFLRILKNPVPSIFSTDQKNELPRKSKFEPIPFNIFGMICKHKFENHRAWKLEGNAVESNGKITGNLIR